MEHPFGMQGKKALRSDLKLRFKPDLPHPGLDGRFLPMAESQGSPRQEVRMREKLGWASQPPPFSLYVAHHILLDVELFCLLHQLMGCMVHRWPIFLVE